MHQWPIMRDDWCAAIDALLLTERYTQCFLDFLTEEQLSRLPPLKKMQATKRQTHIHEQLLTTSVRSPYSSHRRLLLFFPAQAHYLGNRRGLGTFWPNASRECFLCRKCFTAITCKQPQMPTHAIANGMWGGPLPQQLECLTYAERKVVQRARLYISVRRLRCTSTKGNRLPKFARSWVHSSNVIAFPQEPEKLS